MQKEEKKVEIREKHPLLKLWDIILIGLSAFLLVFCVILVQAYQEVTPDKKVVTPSTQVEQLKKEVDSVYHKKNRTVHELFALYSKIRKEESTILKTAKANDEKSLLKTEILLLKQDVMLLMEEPDYPAEKKLLVSKK